VIARSEADKGDGPHSEKVLSQIESFKKGFPYARLNRPCTVGDGIHVLSRTDLDRYADMYAKPPSREGP